MEVTAKQPKNVTPAKHDKIYFVERTNDGKMFMMNEKEVQRKFYENTSIYNSKFEVIGVSDGSTMREYVKEHGGRNQELKKKKNRLEDRLDKYVEKEDELLFEQLVEDDDERLQRLQRRKEETKEKIKDLIEEISQNEGKIWKEARDAELEVAKENGPEIPDAPSDIIHSKRSSEKDKQKIERLLGK